MPEPERPKCKYCEKPFSKHKPWQIFCKPLCRDAYHNLRKALKEITNNSETPLNPENQQHASSEGKFSPLDSIPFDPGFPLPEK